MGSACFYPPAGLARFANPFAKRLKKGRSGGEHVLQLVQDFAPYARYLAHLLPCERRVVALHLQEIDDGLGLLGGLGFHIDDAGDPGCEILRAGSAMWQCAM